LFLAAERYLPLAERAGLTTRSLVSEEKFARMANNPQLWHPRHGARLIFQEAVADFLHEHYRWLESDCEPSRTLLVSHVLDFAGRVYRDKYPETRFVSVLPAPALLRSHSQPPRLSSHAWERWVPKWLLPLAYRSMDLYIDRLGAEQINKLRSSLHLPAVRRILHRWWWSPDLQLCLFPEWFSVPSRDLLPQMKLVGFPLADSGDVVAPSVRLELEQMLARLGESRPLVFAPGTAHQMAAPFLQAAAEACGRLKQPGILLSSDSGQFPASLPAGVTTANYLPFSELLPRAAAIVHHGGIGTTSQSLRAGIPQLVVPMAFDQFDNAERVTKLGCGDWLPMRRVTADRLKARLQNLNQRAPNTFHVSSRWPADISISQASFASEVVAAIGRVLEPLGRQVNHCR
jgi:hypothetical protein